MADLLTRAQFAASVKAKYPQYATVPDDQLVATMLEKYPIYRDRIRPDGPPIPDPRTFEKQYGADNLMTPDERRVFDQMIAGQTGLPLLAPVAQGARAVGAMLKGGQMVNAAKAAASTAAPMATYATVKTGLRLAGVPEPVAEAGALYISGKLGGKLPSPSGAGPAAPAGSSPGVPRSPSVPEIPGAAPTRPVGPQWSPQRLANEVGLAARRAGVKLNEQEYKVAEGMVRESGVSPMDAVKTVAAQLAKPPAAPKLKLNVEEGKVYMRLRGQGQSHEQATEAIASLRAMAKGLPSSQTVDRRVADRNATGRWHE